MVRHHNDKYNCFADLARYEREGIDYRILVENRNSDTTILAPHGGKIESATSWIAKAIAGQEFNLYCFEGIKKNHNYEALHITSHRFDEPRCIQLLSPSKHVIVIHGCDGRHKTVFVGGRNKVMRNHLTMKLQEAGIVAHGREHGFPGEEASNICNRGATGEGIQMELTKALRESSAMDELIATVRMMFLARQVA